MIAISRKVVVEMTPEGFSSFVFGMVVALIGAPDVEKRNSMFFYFNVQTQAWAVSKTKLLKAIYDAAKENGVVIIRPDGSRVDIGLTLAKESIDEIVTVLYG